MIKIVTQNHGLGCGVACVASVLGISYTRALKLFKNPKHAWTRGYYCLDLVHALKKGKKEYTYKLLNSHRDAVLRKPGTIVFTKPSPQYPYGHFLVRTQRGWMNPWVNFPEIAPAKSGIVKRLPTRAQFAIYEIE